MLKKLKLNGSMKPIRPFKTNTQKRCPFHYRRLECKSRKSGNTWSNKQVWPWSIEWSRAKAVLEFCQENSLVIANTLFQQHKGRLYTWTSPDGQHTQLCATLCDPMDCSTPGLPVHHQLPEFTQTHAYWVSDAIQPSHPLSSPSPPAFSLSQHQSFFHGAVLCIWWPNYWSFSFSISPSNEYSGYPKDTTEKLLA